MAVDFQQQRARFTPHTGGPQIGQLTFVFPTNVRKAESIVNGFNIGFSKSDHHLFRAAVDTTVLGINLNTVHVRVDFALKDSSGIFDDAYDGFVDVLVLVDRE